MSNSHALTRTLGTALIVAIAVAPALAATERWLPLHEGNTWTYQGDQGGHQTETMTGTTTLHGRTVFTKHYYEGADAGLENFWLAAFDGSVLLAGFRTASGFGYVYEPPIQFLPSPPTLGPRAEQPISWYDFATDQLLFSGGIRFDVLEDVTLSLPAGSFHAFGVGQYVSLPGPGADGTRLTLDGRITTPGGKSIYILEPTDWFSDGTGIVQYRSGQLYQLESYGGPTAGTRSSWAAIKRLYR
jgi:hypothetical protein